MPGCDAEALESHLAKYRSLCPSLALLLHLADHNTGPIGAVHVAKAADWCDYLEGHARRVYAAVSEADDDATRLIASKIRSGKITSPFKPWEITNQHWSGLDKTVVGPALDILEELGWLRIEAENTGGRPSTVCKINPQSGPGAVAAWV